MVCEDNKKYRHLHSTLTMPEANDRSRLPFFTTFVVIEVSEIYCSTKRSCLEIAHVHAAAQFVLGVVSKTEEKCVNSKFTTCSFFSKQMVYIIHLIDLKMDVHIGNSFVNLLIRIYIVVIGVYKCIRIRFFKLDCRNVPNKKLDCFCPFTRSFLCIAHLERKSKLS